MKKVSYSIAFVLLTLFVFNSSTSVAQMNQGHVFHVNTSYMVTGLDSTARAERDGMLKEYLNKVTMKNDLILHQWTMTHFFSEDSREFVTIYEFANWDNIEKAFAKDSELEKQAWPDEKKRTEFLKKMNSYFTHHKDAVYNSLPGMNK